MKLLMTLAFAFSFSVSAFAVDERVFTYYQPQYEIVSAELICPITSGGIRCMAYGSKIKIKSTLNGCLDKVAFFESQTRIKDGIVNIYVTGVGKYNPKNDVVRCVKIPEDFRTIYIGSENYKEINIINLPIKQ